jgi:ureidoacrylate peracid hydrolase
MCFITINAEPVPIEIDLERAALVVVDMQNCFLKKGGVMDQLGLLTPELQATIKPCQEIVGAARSVGIKIIYLRYWYRSDLLNMPNSETPEYKKIIELFGPPPFEKFHDIMWIEGTWGFEIVDELMPEQEDIIVNKPTYSGFVKTDLESLLRTYEIKYLIITGVTSSICVESTIRDAFFRGFFPILVRDTTWQDPRFRYEATIFNVKQLFGWVTTSTDIIKALKTCAQDIYAHKV